MKRRFGWLSRPLFAVMLIFTVFACGGGGCSGCEGCAIAPIPGGFPIDQRIPNSAQVRLSESGIGFIEENIGSIIGLVLPSGLDFDIPETSASGLEVCPGGGCKAHAEIENLDLVPTPPNQLNAHIRVLLESRNAGGERAPLPVSGLDDIVVCNVDIDTSRGSRSHIGLVANIALQEIDEPARAGYTELDLNGVSLAPGEGIENEDLRITADCPWWNVACQGACAAANSELLKPIIINLVTGQISGLLDGALGGQLCTRQGEHGCPTGTFADGEGTDAVCRYAADPESECVPTLLGMDGRGDLGAALLGGFSPGTHATGQFVLASGGDAEAVNEGMSVFMLGGFMSMDRAFATSPGHNPCVPVREAPPLPDVARADAFRGNVIPGTSTTAHVGIGIAEDYLDYAGYGLFDSGMLCVGAGTRLSQELSTGLVSGAIGSLRLLTFPLDAAALSLAVRPQYPPEFTIGTDAETPLLNVFLRELQLDWYAWSSERYVRFMTYQTDLTVRINLAVENGAIVPRVTAVEATNSSVFNDELLTDNPAQVAMLIETVLTEVAGQFAGDIDPIMLPSIMGFELEIPSEGIRGVASNGEALLGIFANLRIAGSPVVSPVETTLSVSDLVLDAESMSLEHWGEGEGNSVWLRLGASGAPGASYEYSYRIDRMTWSEWTSEPRVRIDDDVLLLQARHTIEARARLAGESNSADPSPARAELIVDVLPPDLQVSRDGTAFVVEASDIVSGRTAIEYRFRVRDGEWSPWQSSPRFEPDQLVVDGGLLGVEARDEAGNVSTATFPLIRGLPNSSGGGCDCGVAVGHTDRNGPLALLGSLVLLGAVVLRRRRAKRAIAALALALPLALAAQGCTCTDGNGPAAPCNDQCVAASPPTLLSGQICCASTNECAVYDVDALCEPGHTCAVANVTIDPMSCQVSCSMCDAKPPLDPGLRATYLDFVVAESGESYVSGYSAGVPARRPSDALRYGDLVFGTIGSTGDVEWEIVDGAPRSPIVADPDGWRGGVSAPGDDVGRWTSMADSGSSLYIAYHDVTHGALKMAIGSPGAWSTHTVDDAGLSGRYASLVLLEGGIPAVAYLRIEPAEGETGRLRSSVRIAIASSAAPASATDWTLTEIAGAEMVCRPEFCGTGEVCLSSGACVVPTSDCAEACGDNNHCVNGTCQEALRANYVEDLPPAYGLHVNLARTPSGGLAAIWYDRSQGNLYGAELPTLEGAWSAPLLIDGYARGAADAGDSGIGASLFVDAAGTWHVTYVDGAEEALRYASVVDGAVTSRQTIDDGLTDGMTQYAEGRHVIGDDSSVVVTVGGEIRVTYQDATLQHLMLARRAAGTDEWTVRVLDDQNHTGFWGEQELSGTISYVATWWRQPDPRRPTNGVRVLTVE